MVALFKVLRDAVLYGTRELDDEYAPSGPQMPLRGAFLLRDSFACDDWRDGDRQRDHVDAGYQPGDRSVALARYPLKAQYLFYAKADLFCDCERIETAGKFTVRVQLAQSTFPKFIRAGSFEFGHESDALSCRTQKRNAWPAGAR